VLPVPGKVLHNTWLKWCTNTLRHVSKHLRMMSFNTPAKIRFCLLWVGGSSVATSFGVSKHFILTVCSLKGLFTSSRSGKNLVQCDHLFWVFVVMVTRGVESLWSFFWELKVKQGPHRSCFATNYRHTGFPPPCMSHNRQHRLGLWCLQLTYYGSTLDTLTMA
jgi:hypothetical protein